MQEDLELRIADIKTDIMKLECAKQDFDEQMHTELAINKAAISVASEIVCQRAVLLSTVHKQFICTFSKSTANSFTSRWLLSQLSRKLHPHIAFACRCRKIGAVIYRQGGDLLYALTYSLGHIERLNKVISEENRDLKSKTPTTQYCMKVASDHLNSLLHKQIANTTAIIRDKRHSAVVEYTVTSMMEHVDSTLWEFINNLTQTVRARRGAASTAEISPRAITKNIRQLYCLAVIMFTINPQCNLPFHLPLTEAVISHGGSLELVHILDGIGAVASFKAHDRLIKGVVKASESDGLINELTPCAFRVVSIDNLDISQKHAQVYVTSSQKSWHGTSIQCISGELSHGT